MVTAWRISHEKHLDTAFTGVGARRFGGRWNTPGFSVVYLSASLPLAMLETLVHLPAARHLAGHWCARAEIPDELIHRPREMPRGWAGDMQVTQVFGDRWLEDAGRPALEVPSVVYRCAIDEPRNYLLNADHPDFRAIGFGPFTALQTDPRFWKTSPP